MKVAFAGDWHANTSWAREAIRWAGVQNCEFIVHVGDFGYDFHPDFLSSVSSALKKANIILYFVDGNHENFHRLYKWDILEDGTRKIADRIFHLPRGYTWVWEGVSFMAMGGAYSVDRRWRHLGQSWWTEETITDDDVQRIFGSDPVDVLISHDVPWGSWIPGIEKGVFYYPKEALVASDVHRQQLLKVAEIVKPKFIFHGHYHVDYQTIHDYGWGPVLVRGLDMDGTSIRRNMHVVDLDLTNGTGRHLCLDCRQIIRIKKDGTFYKHTLRKIPCQGAGQYPAREFVAPF